MEIESPKTESKGSKTKFYLLCTAVCFAAGTKMECIAASRINKIWINFFEHLATVFTSLTLYLFVVLLKIDMMLKIRTFLTYCNKIIKTAAVRWNSFNLKKEGFKGVFSDKRITFLCLISGTFDFMGNVILIFAIKYAFLAEVSPASISCMLMTSTIFVLLFSVIILKENHQWLEYFGAVLVIISVVIISYQRGGKAVVHNEDSPQRYLVLSIVSILTCSILSGLVGITAKSAYHFYKAYLLE